MSPGKRSPEERERARLEREARRAQREGRPPPVAAPPTEVPPPDLAGGVTDGSGAPAERPAPAERVFEPVKPLPAHTRRVAAPPPPPVEKEPEPVPEPVEREPAPPEPGPAPTPVEPEPVANEPEPEPPQVEPEPVANEPEPEPPQVEPEQVANEPEPEPPQVEPEPVANEPEPEPPQVEQPTDDEPALRAEPAAEDEPAIDDDHVPLDHDERALDHDDDPVDHDPDRDYDSGELYVGTLDPRHDTAVEPAPRRPLAPPPYPRPPDDEGNAPPPRRPLPPFPRGGGNHGPEPDDGGSPAEPRRRRRARLVLGLLALPLIVATGWFLVSLFQPFAGEGEGSVAVTIPQGADVATIADLLERQGVIADAFFFRARATVSGQGGDFKAGDFELQRDMSYAAAMDALADSPDADTITVTIPEGRARREVQESIAGTLDGNYIAASRRSPALDPSEYRAGNPESLEGFLFPATYELDRGSNASDLVREQLRTFKREFEKVDLSFARRKNLTPYDVLIIASMVDREAQVARERPLIASVIYNRLSEGIPLGIDATIRFATNNWTEPLTVSELDIDSPYNTRTRQGLPPGPIGSPGLEAIRAAANPRRTDFLFFVVKPGTCGEHAFSETDAQFQRDRERYNSERDARGGRSPTNC